MSFKISIGADPEMFIRDKKTGLFVSAHDKLPGTKIEPHKVNLGAVQVDGVAAEFNINPTYSAQEFVDNIGSVMLDLQNFVGTGFELVSEPVAEFPPDYFKALPTEVRELGCNPDFNAWTGQVNVKPDGDSVFFRTAAGHIHIGWTNVPDPMETTHYEDCRVIAKQLDYYLGLYSLQWDSDTKRRSLYGKAGAFRPKPYGMEYRPLSNVWLRSSRLQGWVWNAANKAVLDVINGNVVEDKFGDLAVKAINGSIPWWKAGDTEYEPLLKLGNYTDLSTPPPLPKPTLPVTSKRVRTKANHKYMGTASATPSIEITGFTPGQIQVLPGNVITASTIQPGQVWTTGWAFHNEE